MKYLSTKVAHQSLYQSVFDEGYVVWTLLPWFDYKRYREARSFMGSKIDLDLEQDVYERCVIYSSFDVPAEESLIFNQLSEEEQKEYIKASRDEQDAGIVSTVVKSILHFSGALEGNIAIRQLDQQREHVGQIEEQLIIAICRAFPSYTPEEVEKMDWQTVLKRAAQAEAIMMGRTAAMPFQIADPEAANKAANKHKIDIQKEIREVGRALRDDDPEKLKREAAEAQKMKSREAGKLREQYFRERGIG